MTRFSAVMLYAFVLLISVVLLFATSAVFGSVGTFIGLVASVAFLGYAGWLPGIDPIWLFLGFAGVLLPLHVCVQQAEKEQQAADQRFRAMRRERENREKKSTGDT
jgi:flagellar biosynthesis component FlhA